MVVDFSSSLYLGMLHSSAALAPWSQLTTGKPAALAELSLQPSVAPALADLLGCEKVCLGRSTLHLCLDVLKMCGRERTTLLLDSGAYPTSAWLAEGTSSGQTPPKRFSHYNLDDLEDRLIQTSLQKSMPIVIVDGYCPGCARHAPLGRLAELIEQFHGLLIIDDTQACGVVGMSGGGSLRLFGIESPNVVLINLLAKSFGVPLACLGGSREFLSWFKSNSLTRVHSSPPSIADLHALTAALRCNQRQGDDLRARLNTIIEYFQKLMRAVGIVMKGGTFPVQSLVIDHRVNPRLFYQELINLGVHAVLHRHRCTHQISISFLLNARHSKSELCHAAWAIRQVLANPAMKENHHELL